MDARKDTSEREGLAARAPGCSDDTGHNPVSRQVYHTGESLKVTSFRASDKRGTRRGFLFRGHDGRRRFKGGVLSQDGIWSTRRDERLILHNPPALALQASLVAELERRGCRRLTITVIPQILRPTASPESVERLI